MRKKPKRKQRNLPIMFCISERARILLGELKIFPQFIFLFR
jgi:hypothetical protein